MPCAGSRTARSVTCPWSSGGSTVPSRRPKPSRTCTPSSPGSRPRSSPWRTTSTTTCATSRTTTTLTRVPRAGSSGTAIAARCSGNLRAGQSITRERSYPFMWSVSDDALVAGLAAGDQDAASAFVRRFQRRVFGLARTIVSDDRAAEDIAQEAFVRAWKHAGAFDARRGSVVSWLLTITRNLSIDAVRVRRPVAFDPVALLDLDRGSNERRPEDLALLQDDTDRLRAALAELPAEQSRAVVLAGLLGYTAREVGEIEDIPLGTAKTRIRTALLRLRAALVSEERSE